MARRQRAVRYWKKVEAVSVQPKWDSMVDQDVEIEQDMSSMSFSSLHPIRHLERYFQEILVKRIIYIGAVDYRFGQPCILRRHFRPSLQQMFDRLQALPGRDVLIKY